MKRTLEAAGLRPEERAVFEDLPSDMLQEILAHLHTLGDRTLEAVALTKKHIFDAVLIFGQKRWTAAISTVDEALRTWDGTKGLLEDYGGFEKLKKTLPFSIEWYAKHPVPAHAHWAEFVRGKPYVPLTEFLDMSNRGQAQPGALLLFLLLSLNNFMQDAADFMVGVALRMQNLRDAFNYLHFLQQFDGIPLFDVLINGYYHRGDGSRVKMSLLDRLEQVTNEPIGLDLHDIYRHIMLLIREKASKNKKEKEKEKEQ